MYKEMEAHRKKLKKEEAYLCKIIDHSPPGKFYIARSKGYTKWYISDRSGKRFYVSKKNKELAEIMTQKRFAELRIEEIKKELFAIDQYLKHCVTTSDAIIMWEDMSRYYDLLQNTMQSVSAKEKIWMNEEFETNPFHPENLTIKCPSGLLVRSKSEMLIVDQLIKNNIPFRYECKLALGEAIKYPDFTFFKASTNELHFHEHFGMLDDKEYAIRMGESIHVYAANGIMLGEELSATYESSLHPFTIDDAELLAISVRKWLDS